jgi:hypothetical protein
MFRDAVMIAIHRETPSVPRRRTVTPMDVGASVIVGITVALATLGIAALARKALDGLMLRIPRRQPRRVQSLSGLVIARHVWFGDQTDELGDAAETAGVPVLDPTVRSTPSRTARRRVRTRTVSRQAGMDVEGHRVAVEVAPEESIDEGVDTGPLPASSDDFWQPNGSTDCPGCASSRLRNAQFCVRCGRRLT